MDASSLVYPVYLDLNMMLGFLAALEGGYAAETEVTSREEQGSKQVLDGNLQAGAAGLLSQFVRAEGRLGGELDAASSEFREARHVRRHNQASLFIRLRSHLQDARLVRNVDDMAADYDSIRRGDLIEFSGSFAHSPARTMATFGRSLAGLLQAMPKPSAPNSGGSGKPKPGRRPRSSEEIATEYIASMEQELSCQAREEFVVSPECGQSGHVTVVLSARAEYASNGDLAELLAGEFTVTAKVTRVLRPGQTIGLLRNTLFGYMPEAELDKVLGAFSDPEAINLQIGAGKAQYPALHVIPLAIFV